MLTYLERGEEHLKVELDELGLRVEVVWHPQEDDVVDAEEWNQHKCGPRQTPATRVVRYPWTVTQAMTPFRVCHTTQPLD